MSDSIDLFMVGGFGRYFTIRWYREIAYFPTRIPVGARVIHRMRHWGKRELGPGRFSIEFRHLALVFENYNPPKGETR